MFNRIQRLGYGQRIIVFILLMVGALMFLAAITIFLILITINGTPRLTATGLEEGVTVREFATLPDEDAFPAAVTITADGTIYTGSYATGVLWKITSDGTVSEVPGTRDRLGSITGLEAVRGGENAGGGALMVLDREYSDPRQQGGILWRLSAEGTLTEFAKLEDGTGLISPKDVAVDGEGRVYVTDRGRREVLRWEADGSGGSGWWKADDPNVIPTGLAFDPVNDAIIVTDSEKNIIFRIPVAGGAAEEVYRYPHEENEPSFDGVTVAPDGTIYVTALEQNGLATLRGGELVYLAGSFRGPDDVEIAPDGSLYVTNFDATPLVVPSIRPQLPFALSVVTLP